MATLHIINQSPLTHASGLRALDRSLATDSILLIENGVYALRDQRFMERVTQHLYALKADVNARGITPPAKGVELVDYDEFVRLTLACDRSVSWC